MKKAPLKAFPWLLAGIILITFLVWFGSVQASTTQGASFLMEGTQFTPVSGDCAGGQGVLKITGFEGNPGVTGTYTGECKDNRPHGKGELVSPDPASPGDWPRTVKGTWKNGAYDGTITFLFPQAKEPHISKEVYAYQNDRREGEARIYDGKGRLLLLHEYRDNRIVSSQYVDLQGEKSSFQYSTEYLPNLIKNASQALAEYHRTLIFDEFYVKTLTDEETAGEIIKLQQAIDENLGNSILVKEKGVTVYEPETTGRLNLFARMHSARMNQLQLGLGRPLIKSYQYAYTSQFLGMKDCLYYTPPEKRPVVSGIVEAIKKFNVPDNLCAGLTIYLAPFGLAETNGYYDPKFGTVALFGSDPYASAAGASTIAHETGHALLSRILDQKGFSEYWALRSVPPRKSQYYAWKDEVFAEDFRVLYGNSETASVMRQGEWRGKYGDIREFPEKKKQVLEFLNRKMKEYQPAQSSLDWGGISYNRLFTRLEAIRLRVGQGQSLRGDIYRFQRIPMGATERYQKKVMEVQFNGITTGECQWTFPPRADFPWDELEILEDGKLIRTCRPNEVFKINTDAAKKYTGRYLKMMAPLLDGPIEYLVEKTKVSSKTLGLGEAVFDLQDFSDGFYQLEIYPEKDGAGADRIWQYFFAVYE